MYRGEPLALWTITTGFFFFILTQIYGYLTYTTKISGISQAHYVLALYGWIGLTILGSELQFFRAITVIRKFTPELLRHIFLAVLTIGVLLMTMASTLKHNSPLQLIGILFYFLGILIHTYWITKKKFSRLFKFPLDYYFIAHFFLLITITLQALESITNKQFFSHFAYTHILTLGWITITLQGALLRIMPFFVGKSIYRPLRPHTTKHLYYTTTASTLFILGILFTIVPLIVLGSFLWATSWLWVLYVLFKSVSQKDRKTLHKITLGFFIPGITWFAIGAFLGMLATRNENPTSEILHIHTILLAGLSLIMLGAMHRIVVFQIYSIIYTGRKREKSEESLLQKKPMSAVLILYNLAIVFFIIGLLIQKNLIIMIGGSLLFTATIAYALTLLPVYIHYFKYKHTALPIHLKKGEDPNTPL